MPAGRTARRVAGGTRSRFSIFLAVWFVAALILPNCVLANTEDYGPWTVEALILMPLGFYMMWSVALRRSGVMIWLGFPFIFFSTFEIVLLGVFGDSVIAADMFTNLLTTNPGEANEVLGNIGWWVALVCMIYLPLLWFAAREIGHRRILSATARKTVGLSGLALFLLGTLALWPACRADERRRVLRDEIFPLNALYNMGLSGREFRRTRHFPRTSEGFSFGAVREAEAGGREIYVYVIGEASRAMSWRLIDSTLRRETTPRLLREEEVLPFGNMLTQSNTTHKSVPLMLSPVPTDRHDELYRRKGLPALFAEAGFETWFISNQSRQGAMIDHLAAEADHRVYIHAPRHDMQLLEVMREAVAGSRARKMLFILHCYGSHFSYHCRYPREEARWLPDDDAVISPDNAERLRNAYDNSVLYTDRFLAETIGFLRSEADAVSALLYCADHGEDLLDDARHRFLHASPTPTAYQLWVASLAWFSDGYRELFPEKVAAARANRTAPANTSALFHTMADMASIRSPYADPRASLFSRDFDRTRPRLYLNDHNEAVTFEQAGCDAEDFDVLRRHGIVP